MIDNQKDLNMTDETSLKVEWWTIFSLEIYIIS